MHPRLSKHTDSSTRQTLTGSDCTFPACDTVLSQDKSLDGHGTQRICSALAPWGQACTRGPQRLCRGLSSALAAMEGLPESSLVTGHASLPYCSLSVACSPAQRGPEGAT